jgi:uncharacterized MnhB-related membrane protein
MTDRFNTALEPLWVFLQRGMIVRRAILFIAIWMTLDSYNWAKMYAMTDAPDPVIYAAVLGVPSALLVAAIKFYNEVRSVEK